MNTGIIKWFSVERGYGFIESGDKSRDKSGDKSEDIFLHVSALEKAGISNIREGQKVSYEISNERGKAAAVNIQLI